ncbi:hypothetical protein SARC_07392 [Sphaeroforma arctica JP610]|uniref:Uncharacterized protein n=1 Tax=Sphaeroforma arctica JP610 TaxID=667725 RepID=A0A0L0FUB3_9EUKA|nr:hypothetical protein SARC_07392 [Sphaeroforma arctica JP610]KNC80254.1 hypothetical protein SARC_07392 [Sphaeroforma arctica JP610]|eukprot:XP_014154156.1 hypothetical protein SARC_07392 [Sphaeroforma arctica JP610]
MVLFIHAWHIIPAKRLADLDKVLMYSIDRSNVIHVVNVCNMFPELYVGIQAAKPDVSSFRAKLETSKTFSKSADKWMPLIDKAKANPANVHTLEHVVNTTLYYSPSKVSMARLRFKNEKNRRALINTLNPPVLE